MPDQELENYYIQDFQNFNSDIQVGWGKISKVGRVITWDINLNLTNADLMSGQVLLCKIPQNLLSANNAISTILPLGNTVWDLRAIGRFALTDDGTVFIENKTGIKYNYASINLTYLSKY